MISPRSLGGSSNSADGTIAVPMACCGIQTYDTASLGSRTVGDPQVLNPVGGSRSVPTLSAELFLWPESAPTITVEAPFTKSSASTLLSAKDVTQTQPLSTRCD